VRSLALPSPREMGGHTRTALLLVQLPSSAGRVEEPMVQGCGCMKDPCGSFKTNSCPGMPASVEQTPDFACRGEPVVGTKPRRADKSHERSADAQCGGKGGEAVVCPSMESKARALVASVGSQQKKMSTRYIIYIKRHEADRRWEKPRTGIPA